MAAFNNNVNHDTPTKTCSNEAERIAALRAQGILDSQPSECFDRIASLAGRVLKCPVALITFVDSERVWFKSNIGFGNISEVCRTESVCHHAILPGAPNVTAVLDTSIDEVFNAHPSVIRPPYIRFYAGAPIKVTYQGKVYKIGMVCVMDKKPRVNFEQSDEHFLSDVASIVADEIQLFRGLTHRVMEENQRYITCTAHDLRTPLQVFRYSIDFMKDHLMEQQQREHEDKSATTCSEPVDETSSNMASSSRSRYLSPDAGRSFSGSSHLTSRDLSARTFAGDEAQSTRFSSTPAARNIKDMMDVVQQAEGACDMMSETVSNAIDAARARWARVRHYISSGSRGFLNACKVKTEGGLKQDLEEVEVLALFKDCRRLRNWHHGERVGWSEEIAPEVPRLVIADAIRTRRVLLNLVTNACKHLASKAWYSYSNGAGIDCNKDDQGKIIIRALLVATEDTSTIGITDNPPKQWIRIEVHDNGDGVPNDLRSQLFVDAFVAKPWTGKCNAPPTTDPRGGEPEPATDNERSWAENSATSEMNSYNGATGGSKMGCSYDSGPQIESEPDVSIISSHFDQYSNDFARHQGSGLGLFVANLCVQEMGGNIGFRCARDLKAHVCKSPERDPSPQPLLGGSVFWFDIPFVPVGRDRTKPEQCGSFKSNSHSPGLDSDSNSTQKGSTRADDSFGDYISQGGDNDHLRHHSSASVSSLHKETDSSGGCVGFDGGGTSSQSTSGIAMPFMQDLRVQTRLSLIKPCVLVVDDSIMVQKLLCRLLARLNIDTDTACNGQEGLIKMKEVPYCAVLMDFLMPVMDGITATAEIRAWERERDSLRDRTIYQARRTSSSGNNISHRHLVIGISANVSDLELKSAWEAGIDHFLKKPVKVADVARFFVQD